MWDSKLDAHFAGIMLFRKKEDNSIVGTIIDPLLQEERS